MTITRALVSLSSSRWFLLFLLVTLWLIHFAVLALL